jgi:hypothetical protein
MYRKVHEVTGFADTENGSCYCMDCAPEGLYPIFLGDKWDQAPTCDACHCAIEVTELNPPEHSDDAPEDDEAVTYCPIQSWEMV